MKDDAPCPERPPRKRKDLQSPNTLDRWLQLWLTSEYLTVGERNRVQDEIERRKKLQPEFKLGVVVGAEGITKPQQLVFIQALNTLAQTTEIHHSGLPSRVHQMCRRRGVPVVIHEGHLSAAAKDGEVIRSVDLLIALPPTIYKRGHVWEMVRYAKHRTTPVTLIGPKGEVIQP